EGEAILDAILRHGRFVEHGCKQGGCGTCRARLVSGACRLGGGTSYALSDADREEGVVLLCSTYVEQGDAVVDVSETMSLTADAYMAGLHTREHLCQVERIGALGPDLRGLSLR